MKMTERLKRELLIRNRFNEMFAKKFFIAMQSGNNYLNMYRLMPNGGTLLVNYTTIS